MSTEPKTVFDYGRFKGRLKENYILESSLSEAQNAIFTQHLNETFEDFQNLCGMFGVNEITKETDYNLLVENICDYLLPIFKSGKDISNFEIKYQILITITLPNLASLEMLRHNSNNMQIKDLSSDYNN